MDRADALRETILRVLMGHRLMGWEDGDGEKMLLLDHLSPGPTVEGGRRALEVLADDLVAALRSPQEEAGGEVEPSSLRHPDTVDRDGLVAHDEAHAKWLFEFFQRDPDTVVWSEVMRAVEIHRKTALARSPGGTAGEAPRLDDLYEVDEDELTAELGERRCRVCQLEDHDDVCPVPMIEARIGWTEAGHGRIAEALNRAANVANGMNPDCPLNKTALRVDQRDLWDAINEIREVVYGPHNGLYPIAAPTEDRPEGREPEPTLSYADGYTCARCGMTDGYPKEVVASGRVRHYGESTCIEALGAAVRELQLANEHDNPVGESVGEPGASAGSNVGAPEVDETEHWWERYHDTPCATCGHTGAKHDAEAGNCETHRTDGGVGVCPCNQYVPATLAPAGAESSPEATDQGDDHGGS